MSENRKLAAILAADVVGYSRMASADEDRTLARLRALRSDLIDPTIAVHNGRVIKRTGDGALVEFRSVVDAVRCALEVQNGMVERNAGVPQDRRIEFRIGIHLGDVVVESDGDLMGDGVNIASRLEGVAAPGAICLSEDAYRQVKARLDLSVSDLGNTQLKNIAEPIRVYSLRVGTAEAKATATSESATSRLATVPPPKLSIAVLPFANMSGDVEQEYFADGISEDIITALSKLSQLFVIARNSSFTFKGRNVNVQEVGRNLGVRYVLEGSVRKSGSRVRITAQLIDATTGGHLWAERFDRDLTDIFAVQDDVTQQIVGALALNLTEGDQQRLATEQTDNLEAYDCFLRGREQLWRFTRAQNIQSRELLQRAIELDPKFAPAYAFLAVANVLDYANQWSPSSSASLEQAEAFATRAVELDDRYPWAHWALAIINLYLRRHDVAIRKSERTISLAPNLAEGHESLGTSLYYSGRPEEALACFERGMALNPYYPDIFLHFQAQATFQLGRYEEAIGILKRRLVRNPDTDVSRVLLAASYGHLGRCEEARHEWQEVFRVNPDYSLEHRRKVLPYKNPDDFELVVDGLRKAGLV
ncbi:adenylate/guanylate cyclase domain-containing protein [Mesorhizobium sp.]|uniref:adenylate/guanylate cyclase domain-containing protein n=1 Tax=Mesorhizobium sp. TaxID=1871066 RepID=UPI000FE41022|nr:adenylate/guanylate cyclase domain-containing protein [Mesorhizobium sp.]RWB92805.1 MAG: adenylate/guanylate cyclase domain-containing protein [Mesorhizobium sp.]RWO99464.1 MAG: adenylate/guanylate cyclase domain-containing protein [Mesorhizobium sp.]RWP28006.1 MAG: adenylate/guanylate cyclase domain-containing protein [Mesorhizobium sp.]RWQ12537.1 MAG: adenylate/guanylate cyclase domain-containing protein [Mesorhizobium sp.]